MHSRSSLTAIAGVTLALLAPTPALASNGFVLGLEFGGGPWAASPSRIAADSSMAGVSVSEAQAFTAPMAGQWRPDLNLHLGWNVLGHVAIEGVFQAAWWSPFNNQRGGVGLGGGRLTWYPLQIFLPHRVFDVGLEAGGGWSEAGGPTYGMTGAYFDVGVTAEYYPIPRLSIEVFYRYFGAPWNTFVLNYDANTTVVVSGFSASWNTLGIGLNLHFT